MGIMYVREDGAESILLRHDEKLVMLTAVFLNLMSIGDESLKAFGEAKNVQAQTIPIMESLVPSTTLVSLYSNVN